MSLKLPAHGAVVDCFFERRNIASLLTALSLSAVSYTHLDVYKRQTLYLFRTRVVKWFSRGNPPNHFQPFAAATLLRAVLHCSLLGHKHFTSINREFQTTTTRSHVPVSYTHLDVYKRQF